MQKKSRDNNPPQDLPAQERERRSRLEYQRQVQEKVRRQTEKMFEMKREMEKTREKKEKLLEEEKKRQLTREWWRQPASSSTMTWVHTGGARGTSEGEVREWTRRANESLAVMANTTVRDLDATLEEIEVLELDQTLTLDQGETEEENDTTMGGDRVSKGEKPKTKRE